MMVRRLLHELSCYQGQHDNHNNGEVEDICDEGKGLTVSELKSTFLQMVKKVCSKHSDRQFVIIIDGVDQLESETAGRLDVSI